MPVDPSLAIVDANMMRRVIESASVGRLGTVGTDRQPHVVPICFALSGDVIYSAVDHKPKRSARLRRVANIEATGRACLLVDEYSDDWSRLWWVRVDGRGRVVGDADEARAAVAALIAKYEQYVERPPTGTVIAVEADRWSGWSADLR
jgi:PPOX class probable F420-dependent enzyme